MLRLLLCLLIISYFYTVQNHYKYTIIVSTNIQPFNYNQMKKIILSLGLLAGSVFGVMAQEHQHDHGVQTQAPVSNNPNAPEISFETEVHDFGVMKQGADGSYAFKFKNTGKEPLIISNAQGSCGCTVPTYPKDQPIAPGASGVIKVTYDTQRIGAFTKTVSISSNAKTAQKTLTIKGRVDAPPAEEAFPGKKESGAAPVEKTN